MEKRTKSQNARRSRRKGHQFERDVANLLKEIFPNAKRQLEYQIDECVGVDIANTGVYKIQCKKLKSYAPLSRLSEVKCDRELGDVPVLVTAGDDLEPIAALPLSDLLQLIKLSEK